MPKYPEKFEKFTFDLSITWSKYKKNKKPKTKTADFFVNTHSLVKLFQKKPK